MKVLNAHVPIRPHMRMILAEGDSDGGWDLFGPDSEQEELEDGPGSPHHGSRERTSDGVRVHVDGDRVLIDGMSPDADMDDTADARVGTSIT